MTRENKPAAQSAARRAASLLTGALLIAGLAGCGSSLFQNSDTADASLKAKPAVALSPSEGVPQKFASKVDGELAKLMVEKGVRIVDAKDAQYIVKPSYAALSEPKQGTKVAYTINITDKAGNKVRSITGEEIVSAKRGGEAWSHVTEDSVQKVAAKSAVDIAAWVDNPNAPPPSAAVASAAPAPVKTAANTAPKSAPAKPVAPQTASLAASFDASAAAPAKQEVAVASGPVVAIVPEVTGAPGDGKKTLSEAMKRALNKQGIKTVANARGGAYKIVGQVEVEAAANGQQPITIRWVVVDPTGKQLEKTVVQKNKVAAGSLDGPWGDIADQAAGAAASEVTKLLQKPAQGQAQQGANGSAG
ncbi:MAG: hypothetical protein ACLP7P_00590 [Rhodomicrobium sp.]